MAISGWPRQRPLRIAFMSDLHAGSHADDVARLTAIVKEAAVFKPDLVLHGGDFVNMQLFGGGRLSPYAIARILPPLMRLLAVSRYLAITTTTMGLKKLRQRWWMKGSPSYTTKSVA